MSAVNAELAGYLGSRRTIPALQLGDPGPDAEALRGILAIAARVPDHGKLVPWRFIVFDRASRSRLVGELQAIAGRFPEPREAAARVEKAKTFGAAPTVVAVVSRAGEHPKIPVWEQQLSAGAACLNLVHAAHAYGFSGQWLSGWYAYDPDAARLFGLGEGERIAGFIHIGTPTVPPSERDRPDLDAITTHWGAETA